MKKSIILFAFFAIALSVMVSCQKKQPTNVTEPVEPEVAEVYQPVHQTEHIKLADLNCYTYYASPTTVAALDVIIKYDEQPYAASTSVTYFYENGDTYTYVLPKEFAIRKNELGRLRIVQDQYHTVWIQGQNAKGMLYEVVFIGDPVHDGYKIRPNSYKNHPYGVIEYYEDISE